MHSVLPDHSSQKPQLQVVLMLQVLQWISADSTAAGPTAGFDPVLISLIRRAMPNLIAYDLAGVQPMTGPTGLIFAMRSRYTNQSLVLKHSSMK
jgi:hypothetical protein